MPVSALNWPGYRTIAWGGIALLAGAIIYVAWRANWWAAAALAGFLVISVLFVTRVRRLPTLFDMIFVIAALINAGGWAWDWYNQPGLYDEVAHLFTMFAITLTLGYLLYGELMAGFYDHRVMFVITIASMGIAIGALWEVVEWLADFVIEKQIVSGLPDTITDIMLDSAGALIAALLNLRGLHESAQADRARK
jgi:hypothetical protein